MHVSAPLFTFSNSTMPVTAPFICDAGHVGHKSPDKGHNKKTGGIGKGGRLLRTKQICCLLVCLVGVTGCFPRSHQAAPDPQLNTLETNQPSAELTSRQPPYEVVERPETGKGTISFVLEDKPHPLPHQPLPLPKFHLTTKDPAHTESANEGVRSDSTGRKTVEKKSVMKPKKPRIPEPAQSASQNTKSGISQRHLSLAQLRMKYPHIFKLHGSSADSAESPLPSMMFPITE